MMSLRRAGMYLLNMKFLIVFILMMALVTSCGSTKTSFNSEAKGPLPKVPAQDLSQFPQRGVKVKNFRLNTTSPAVPKSVPVYDIVQVDAEARARKIVQDLKLTLQKVNDVPNLNMVSAVCKEGTLNVSKGGGGFVFYFKELDNVNQNISREQAIQTADEFLKGIGIDPGGLEVKNIGFEVVHYSNGKTENRKPSITYVPKANADFDLLRRFSYIQVDIGSNGKVSRFSNNTKEVKKTGDYPIINLQQAIEKISNGNGVISTEAQGTFEEALISSIDLTYLDSGSFSEAVKIYQPFYLLTGTIDSGKFAAYVPALQDEFLISGNGSE